MVRKLILTLFVMSGISQAVDVFKVSPLATRTPGLSGVELYHCNGQFVVGHEGSLCKVDINDVDAKLRNLTSDELENYAGMGKFLIKQYDNGQFSVKTAGGLNGGGAGGATAGFYIGKFLTHFVGQAGIQIAAICTGPAYPVTLAALEATCLPVIEAASNVVGLGCGVVGAVATGPV